MSVKIRLRRMGSNNKRTFRVVATDSRRSNTGRFLEYLGWYDPKKTGTNYELKLDRIEYWKSKGAELTDTVQDIIKRAKKVSAAAPTPAATA